MAAYWIPIVVFAVFTSAESYVSADWYPAVYFAKACAVSGSLLAARTPWRDVKFSRAAVWSSVFLGIAVCAVWLIVDKVVPYPHLSDRTAFDPSVLQPPFKRFAFLAVRFYGLVLMVPVMEELFWRSFLLRYLTNSDFQQLPIGQFSTSALWIMVAASALAHPEWLVGGIANLAYALWLRRTRSLLTTIIAHSTTNAALGVYILIARDWQYW